MSNKRPYKKDNSAAEFVATLKKTVDDYHLPGFSLYPFTSDFVAICLGGIMQVKFKQCNSGYWRVISLWQDTPFPAHKFNIDLNRLVSETEILTFVRESSKYARLTIQQQTE